MEDTITEEQIDEFYQYCLDNLEENDDNNDWLGKLHYIIDRYLEYCNKPSGKGE